MKEKIKKYINKKTAFLFLSVILLLLAGGMIGWMAFQENQKSSISEIQKNYPSQKENSSKTEEVNVADENIVISNRDEAQKEVENMDNIINSLSMDDLME